MSDAATGEGTQVIYDGHIVRLELQGGKWEIVRHADAVAILALNDAGEMLFVRQRRRAVDAMTLEAPAGLIDDGESPEEAARRELQEEVGLDGDMTLLTRFYSSPGFCDEELYVLQARNLRESRLDPDEDEDLETVWMPPQAVLDGLRDGTFKGSASTVTAALFAVQLLARGEG
ncbi:DNA mismatch repair protein MutT [Deinococcus aetherius]|uniref:DNA mismatch repair protein MutT n=1 Tax=Deinococcus aetherius TaxID=200252 RepID=A0ABM8AFK8_9DEIO|nr:NUDIX hydrolase [Deinococcus aetherius]BDP42560.1 DNA mismatch repair protein MutT [Deinococcus aetherius]